jgi:hypothetical protein
MKPKFKPHYHKKEGKKKKWHNLSKGTLKGIIIFQERLSILSRDIEKNI